LTRLQSHFQFNDCVKSKNPSGECWILAQEDESRDPTPLAQKANDALISREVVILKAELEKFREQAQNVE
jgi:uncharacterized protein YicC (UPF0701 family)